MSSMYVATPLATITTGQYEQAMLHNLLKKRISIFQYVKKTHEVGEYWCDTVLCTKEDFERFYSEQKGLGRRTMNYMILGMSISGLLDFQGSASDFLKAFNQLLHEFEYHSTHEPGSLSGKPKMRNFFKPVKGAPTRRSEGNLDISFSVEVATNPSSYTYLNSMNIPFEPDFIQTFCSLLGILMDAYQHIVTLTTSPQDCTQAVVVAFQKVDEKIKKGILAWVVKEADDFSRAEVQNELESLEKLMVISSPT